MKTNLDTHFKVNDKIAAEGIEFAIDDKTHFKLRHFNATNPRVKAAMAAHYKPYARQLEMGTLGADIQLEIQIKLFTDISLVDWKGVVIDEKEVECNPANALKLFKALPQLFEVLFKHAGDFNNYKEELGNS